MRRQPQIPSIALTGIYFVILMSLLHFDTTDAYSVIPPLTTRKHDPRFQQRIQKETRHDWKSSSYSQMPTALRASRSFDYARNATSAPPSVLDDEETRMLQFMEDALLELESFQSGSSNENVYAHGFDDGEVEYPITNSQYAYLENPIHHDGVSLLFPPDNGVGDDVSSTTVQPNDKNIVEVEERNLDGVWRARWLLVAAAALYGTNFSVVKLLGDEMPVGISTSLRFGLAALATLPWLIQGFVPGLNTKVSQEVSNRRVMATLYGLEVGLWNSIGYVAQAVGLETTLASESAFLCSMAVVIVPLLDWIVGKKLLSRQWVGALMALVGVAFLELGDMDSLTSGTLGTGAQLSLIQPFTFGLGFWRMEQAMHEYPDEAPRMTAAQLMAIFISSVGYGLWTMGVFEPFLDNTSLTSALNDFQTTLAGVSTAFPWGEWSRNPSILFSLFWTGCITTALTIYMETLALESLSAAETTLIFSTEPLWGTAFAVAVMGEQMGMHAVVGAGLILTACVYSNLGVSGLQEFWSSSMAHLSEKINSRETAQNQPPSSLSRALQDHWPWLSGSTATLPSVASAQETQEFEAIVEDLIENLADKL